LKKQILKKHLTKPFDIEGNERLKEAGNIGAVLRYKL